ncbi:MAG: (Fe-S)-binding protein [Bacillota bacterium]
MTAVDELAQIVGQCDRCGACQAVCPLFECLGKEATVARGKLAILRAFLAGGLGADPVPVSRALDLCLLCHACAANCPSKVKAPRAVLLGRAALARSVTPPRLVRAVDAALARPGVLALAGLLMRAYHNARVYRLLKGTGVLGLVRALVGEAMDFLPPPGGVPESRSSAVAAGSSGAAGRRMAAGGTARGKVHYFAGCMMKTLYPHVSRATISLLEAAGYQVEVPPARCCGLPLLAHGQLEEARRLASQNVAIFRDAEMVVTDCASCGASLKDYGWLLGSDPVWRVQAGEFAGKVRDVSEFLLGVRTGEAAPAAGRGCQVDGRWSQLRVTYHDPCHLVRGQKIKAPPRELVRATGVQFVEMAGADTCCGGGGSFHLVHRDVSQRILERKIRAAEETGAQLLLTACPGCLMQLQYGVHRAGISLRVMHLVEFLLAVEPSLIGAGPG